MSDTREGVTGLYLQNLCGNSYFCNFAGAASDVEPTQFTFNSNVVQ